MNTIDNLTVSRDRKYVIVCNRHPSLFPGCLLFWGQLTGDGEKRSFGGYTTGIDRCERYTLDEILEFSSHFSVYKQGMSRQEFLEKENVIVEPGDLAALGFETMRVCYRP